MQNLIKIQNYNYLIINVLFILLPVAFILGNFYTNLNIVLISLYTLFFYWRKKKYFKFNFFDKIITLFFIYTICVLLINFIEAKISGKVFSQFIINKSFFYLRYYFLYVSLRLLINNNIIKLNWFFLSCTFFSIFVCVDIYIQYFFGKDIFGIEPVMLTAYHAKLGGPFGEELIAGGYIQRFFLFAFLLPSFLNLKKKFFITSIQLLLILIFTYGIILSGNRMPFVLFIFSIFMFAMFDKNLKKYLIHLILISIFVLTFLYNKNEKFRIRFESFHGSINNLTSIFITKSSPLKSGAYVQEVYGFLETWPKKRFFGGGVKSYRINCVQLNKDIPFKIMPTCNNHPHNYYFEILVDLGLFGFLIILILYFSVLHKLFFKKYIFNSHDGSNIHLLTFFLLFIVELFPIRSSGSFFSTNNAAFIFVILAVLISLIDKYDEEEKKEKSI